MEPDKTVKSETERDIERRKREKDEHDACAFASAFLIAFSVACIVGNVILVAMVPITFGIILYMDYQKEKVEKRLRLLTRAYYEQLKKQINEEREEFPCAEISVSKGGKVA